jgi:hypothetical protein
MSVGIYHVDRNLFMEVRFHSRVSTDRYNRAEDPGNGVLMSITAKMIMEKYGSGKRILDALLMAPTAPAEDEPAYGPVLPNRMIVIKK